MPFQYTPYILPLFAAAAISMGIAFYIWSRRTLESSAELILLALSVAVWCVGYALEIAGLDLPTKLFWGKMQYLGITTVPLMWMIFAFNYANQDRRMSYRVMFALSVIPLITLVLAFTTEIHGLIWKEIYIYQAGEFSRLGLSYGVWFWTFFAYSYLLLLAGTLIVLRSLSQRYGYYRGQAAALAVAVLAPWTSNILYASGLNLILDPTPFAFTLSLIAITWGIFGYRLFDLSPLARSMIVEEMGDGLIVLDLSGRIADINPSAQCLIGLSSAQAIGKMVTEVLTPWPHLAERYEYATAAVDEMVTGEGEAQHWYEVRLSPLHNRRHDLAGRVITMRNITERKQVEEALAQERNLLRTVIDNIPDQIFARDTASNFTLCNKSDARAMGADDPDMLVGKNDYDFYPPELAALYRADNQVVISSGQPIFNREEPSREVDGRPRWTLTTKVPLWNRQGQVIGVVGIARDVTEQKLAQEKLDRLMQQQQIILDNIPVGVALEKSNRFEWTNHTLAAIIGYAPEEMKSLSMQACCPDFETYERMVKLSHERLALGETFTMEGPLKRKDGSLIWCNVVAQAINPHNLAGDGVLWVIQDITEKRRADEQLRQLSRAVEASSSSIVITDTTGKIQYVNPKFTQVTGYTLTEVIGQNPRILKTDQTPTDVHDQLWKTITSGQEWRGEFCNQKKNGERYWELASISPIIDPAGHITHYVAVKEDITKRKQMEEDLALARDQALEASRYKSELLAKVSHELRTPLGAILGYTEFLHGEMFGALTPKQKHFTTQILNSASYLRGLISDLLDQSQIERGLIRIQLAPFDLREMVEQLNVSLKALAEAKGLNLITDVAAELPATLSGDQKRLRQILTNLANNAIKFTETGSVTVRIQPSGSTHWAMQVIDTGPGISPEVQARVFDSFWQVDSSLTGKQKGYGLGLSIVKQLTKLMGGQITLDSAIGQGSTFTVVFPLEPAVVEVSNPNS